MNFIDLCKDRLPLNRKERYYTATVFPALVCADNFQYFDRFLKLLHHSGEHVDVRTDNVNIQFFTEYSLAEALVDKVLSKEAYPDAPGRDTPDILILINGPEPLLIAIEAKMYGSFFIGQLVDQMDRQEKRVLVHLRNRWPTLRVVHAALLPKLIAKGKNFGGLRPAPGLHDPRPVITWEEILAAFEDVLSVQYFLEVLKAAISKFPELTAVGKGLAEAYITGEGIKDRFSNDEKWSYHTMGRKDGLRGVLEDIKGGSWKKQEYPVNSSSIPATSNWFLISTFTELVDHMMEGAPK